MGAASSMVTNFVTYAKTGQSAAVNRTSSSPDQQPVIAAVTQHPFAAVQQFDQTSSAARDVQHWSSSRGLLNEDDCCRCSATETDSATGSNRSPLAAESDAVDCDCDLRSDANSSELTITGPRISPSAVAQACAAAAEQSRRQTDVRPQRHTHEHQQECRHHSPHEHHHCHRHHRHRSHQQEPQPATSPNKSPPTPSASRPHDRHSPEPFVRVQSRSFAAYVNYIPEIYGTQAGAVRQWWFPSDFCQSRLGDRQIGSNACTLIVVIMAHRIHDLQISIPGTLDRPLSAPLISALAESIVDGNEIHQILTERGMLIDANLTLPEAMEHYNRAQYQWLPPTAPFNATACRTLVEWITRLEPNKMTADSLFEVLHRGIMDWERSQLQLTASHQPNLYAVLIADVRSMLIFYERNLRKVTLLDSHAHGGDHGALVGQADVANLKDLCQWYCNVCAESATHETKLFETTFLYFRTNTIPSRTRSDVRAAAAMTSL